MTVTHDPNVTETDKFRSLRSVQTILCVALNPSLHQTNKTHLAFTRALHDLDYITVHLISLPPIDMTEIRFM